MDKGSRIQQKVDTFGFPFKYPLPGDALEVIHSQSSEKSRRRRRKS